MRSAALAIAVSLLLAACGRPPEPKPDEIRPVRVIRIGEQEAVRSAEFAGEVRARHETRLAFRVPGKLVERLVDAGSRVREGQTLARLDPADLALSAASAKAQLAAAASDRDLAAAELARYRGLREKNFISQAEFERRESALASAQARFEAVQAQARQASNQAGYAQLVADGEGVIVAVEAEAGQVVAAGQTVALLARRGEREIAFSVPESRRGLLEQAAQFEVTLNALPGKSWRASLRELAPAADPVTRTYAARATLHDAGDEVELGMSARIRASAGGAGGRIELPLAALHSRGEAPQVMLVGADSSTRLQPVETAGLAGTRVIIASGLAPGDVVVAAGASLLRPGQKVRVLE
ncbi:MAG: efflux RND transporter periplasmic adaptor subunit [Burkholderiales bacterium]